MEEEIAATPSQDFIRRASGKMELAVCSSHGHIHTHTDSHTTLTKQHARHMLEDQHDVVFSSVLLCHATLKLLTSNQQNTNRRTCERKASLILLFVQFGISYEAEQRERRLRWTQIWTACTQLCKYLRADEKLAPSRLHRSHPDSPTPISCSVGASGASRHLPSSSSLPFLCV